MKKIVVLIALALTVTPVKADVRGRLNTVIADIERYKQENAQNQAQIKDALKKLEEANASLESKRKFEDTLNMRLEEQKKNEEALNAKLVALKIESDTHKNTNDSMWPKVLDVITKLGDIATTFGATVTRLEKLERNMDTMLSIAEAQPTASPTIQPEVKAAVPTAFIPVK